MTDTWLIKFGPQLFLCFKLAKFGLSIFVTEGKNLQMSHHNTSIKKKKNSPAVQHFSFKALKFDPRLKRLHQYKSCNFAECEKKPHCGEMQCLMSTHTTTVFPSVFYCVGGQIAFKTFTQNNVHRPAYSQVLSAL